MSARRVIPHGQVPFADIGDANVRDRIMKLGENDAAIASRIASLETEIENLKRKTR